MVSIGENNVFAFSDLRQYMERLKTERARRQQMGQQVSVTPQPLPTQRTPLPGLPPNSTVRFLATNPGRQRSDDTLNRNKMQRSGMRNVFSTRLKSSQVLLQQTSCQRHHHLGRPLHQP